MHENFITLEWIISEMELKLHEFKIKNPNFDSNDSVKKINSLKKVQDHVYKSFEEIEKFKKEIELLKFTNKKLILTNHATSN